MQKKWITYINLLMAVGCIFLVISALGFYILKSDEFTPSQELILKKTLPKNPFAQSTQAYDAINTSLFKLVQTPYTLQLPDLRKSLIFYGKNDRPDANIGKNALHFGFVGNKTATSIFPNEKRYVYYDRSICPPQYTFSPTNQQTPLWIEVEAFDKEAQIKVRMKSETGDLIEQPWSHAQFSIMQKDFIRTGSPWEIGKWRVDGSLLARQKAKWFGVDRFIENHGGDDYLKEKSKQRIDFGETDDLYSVFIGLNDVLILENEKWKVVTPGIESQNHPLLVVKKVDDRLMQLELWDVNGQSKIILNLLKTMEPWAPQNILQNFKFMGARTRSQFVFEINKDRMLLSPLDWLLLTPKGWKKLNTAKEIDNYVDRKTTGILFIFEGIERKNDQQYIKGLLYNTSRTDVKNIEIPISSTKPPSTNRQNLSEKFSGLKNPSNDDSENDDDDDEDDDDEDDNGSPLSPMNFPIPANIPINNTHPKITDQEKANFYEKK